jgi:Histidine kinase-, DNA gyrase B-, and HSP90-like ATPase
MPIADAESLLQALLAATTSGQVRNILEQVGDYANVELDQPFGPFQFCWHAFGNKESNLSSIGLGTKPGRSLTERLTNAMDAILEDRAPTDVALPQSAREAAQQWFGRPVSGPEDGLFNWDYAEHGYDRRTAVVLTSSDEDLAATVDVVDDGIGIKPEEFPSTILSLQEGNKIKKKHVIGAFGQGGAATLAFADYTVIVSRHRDNPRVVGFTVIRVLKLSEQYKEDCYGYLCLKAPSGDISVPSCQLDDESLVIYPGREGARGVPVLRKGTLVRHVNYQLPKLAGTLGPSPGNLYHYLHGSAFDPLLPFRLIDLRGGKLDNQIVTGSRNRLMKLDLWEPETSPNKSGSYLRHQREMEYFAPHGTQEPCIGVEYWVVFNYKQKHPITLRPQSNELFVQTGHPVVGTLPTVAR